VNVAAKVRTFRVTAKRFTVFLTNGAG